MEEKKLKAFNIYCDESSIDNPQSNMMVIGALFIERGFVPEIKEAIKKIRSKHGVNGELKWVKTSSLIIPFYKDLFEYLFSIDGSKFTFRCIVVDKSQVDYKKYHREDKELAFYKFYYQLLKRRIVEGSYYIFLDFRPSKNRNSVRRLGDFLSMFSRDIKHIQAYSSHENIFIQIADILTGAVSFSHNTPKGSSAKKDLVKIIAKNIGKKNLTFKSTFWENKFNIFYIDLEKRK
ncbi:MAG: DUF3800 domain-containing protein [Nanoarchaeota archaeon]|nr:DUF3800 domain-containing protein [Nanoarchaeota archaeon]